MQRRGDTGSSAVEFALVAPVLFLLLFGIIDYGLWFADSLATRDGARAAARGGSLTQWGDATCDRELLRVSNDGTNPPSAHIRQLACTAVTQVSPISGAVFVKIRVLDPGGADTTTWAVGGALRVCVVEQHDALLPLVPVPGGGIQRAKVQMPIEESGGGPEAGGYDDLPTGQTWDWC